MMPLPGSGALITGAVMTSPPMSTAIRRPVARRVASSNWAVSASAISNPSAGNPSPSSVAKTRSTSTGNGGQRKMLTPPLEFKLDALRGLLCGFKAEGDLIVVDGFRPGIGGGAGGDDEEWEAEEVKGAIHHCELECRGRG